MIVGDFVEWLGNGRPAWAAYRALMSGRLIVLDKQPGIRPVGVVETWQRMMAKCLLRVAGPEAKEACGTTELAGEVEAGIEGASHGWRPLSTPQPLLQADSSRMVDFASVPATLSRHFAISCHQVSPTPTGLIPEYLDRAISRPFIRAL